MESAGDTPTRSWLDRVRRSLDPLCNPASIAVIGASSDQRKVSGRPIQILRDAGYAGRILPINPNRSELQGFAAFPSIGAVEGPVDLALVAVPARAVADALEQCGAAGVRSAVVFGSGFAEVGGEGVAAQHHLAGIAAKHGMRLLGPNCMGLFNCRSRAYVTFATVFSQGWPEPGPIGLVSQSGAFGAYCFARARALGLGLSYGLTTGNEADVHIAECLAFLAEDPGTEIIIGYLEGCRDGPALERALALCAERRKPVILLKVGRSALGAETAQSHTAAMAGDDAVFEAVLARHGAHRAETVDALFDVALTALTKPRLPRGRVGFVTVSGGAGVLMVDAAEAAGLSVPPLPEDAQASLRRKLSFAMVRNPVDTTGIILDDPTVLPEILEALSTRAEVEAVVGFYAGMGLSDAAPELRRALTEAQVKRPDVRLVAATLTNEETRRAFAAAGIPTFEDPARAIAALAALHGIEKAWARRAGGAPPDVPSVPAPDGPVNEHQAKALLARAGIPVAAERLATTAEDAAAAAAAIGFPVALKLLSAGLAHKSEIGGVALSLASAEAVREAAARMLAGAPAGLRIDGLLVAPMADGFELMLGTHVDPVFGPVVMVATGGVYAEILADRVLRPAPVSAMEALEMIRSLRGFPILNGARGRRPADIGAAADALARLSVLAVHWRDRVSAIDINPFMVAAAGATAVDAHLIPKP